MSTSKPDISVVVPVYNSATTLATLIERLSATLDAIAGEYEVVLVDDGSRDDSWVHIQRAAVEHGWIRGIRLMRNYGQQNAVLAGLRATRHPIIVTMDDDLQHPPDEIPKLLRLMVEGYDVVYGTPVFKHHEAWRKLAAWLTKLALQTAMGAETARKVSPFRAIRTNVLGAFTDFRGPFVSVDVLLTWGTTRFAAVPVAHAPREEGRSQYTFRKLVLHALNMVTGFSTVPLQLASIVGLGVAVFGLLVLIYVVGRYILEGGSVPGFPFLASTIAIFSGAQLFALGIMGEYLARMHFRVMDKPAYVVDIDTRKR